MTARILVTCLFAMISTTSAYAATESATDQVVQIRTQAEAGNANAMKQLGIRYIDGTGVEKNDTEAVRWFQKAAQGGNAESMAWLGVMYRDGRGVQKNDPKSVSWYQKSAEAGYGWAMNQLAKAYFDGRGTERDYSSAVKWYRKASDAGNASSMSSLAWMYGNGQGVEKNDAEAAKWYLKAAVAGDSEAMFHLATRYLVGLGLEKSDSEAVKWYQRAAEAGSTSGMFRLGLMFEDGRGVEENNEEAVKWYRKSAEAGDVSGMSNLGVMYRDGKGVAQSDVEAVKWFRKASEAGEDVGMRLLGGMYENGRGVERSAADAVNWYRKAAEAGDHLGMLNMGVMYFEGRGVQKSPQDAVKWFQKAADAGNIQGMKNLGVIYEKGIGLPVDYSKAVAWYRKAAEGGYPNGMFALGTMYEKGNGVPRDYEQALYWYRKAADLGETAGMNGLGSLYARGLGLVKDDVEARKWFRKSADAGDVLAMRNLGTSYSKGSPKDNTEAVKWFRMAAKLGDQVSIETMRKYDADLAAQPQSMTITPQATVSIEFSDGFFSPKRVSILRQLAQDGNGNAMFLLGYIYATGKGVEKNHATALDWHKKAASAKNAGGMEMLGRLHRDGLEGYPRDGNKAAQWFIGALTTKHTRAPTQSGDPNFDRLIYEFGTEYPEHRTRGQLEELLASGEITDPDLIRQVKALSKPAPKLDWVQAPKTTDQEEIELRYRITDQGGGIGDIQIKVDGVAVGDGKGRNAGNVTLASEKNIRSVRLKLAPGEHEVTLLAYNAENLINWSEIQTRITSTYKPVRKPQLHAVVVGINEYGQDALTLRYAVADARAMADTLRTQGPKLYDRVNLKLLDTKGQTGKRGILDALEAVKKDVHPQDLFVFYVAAHGIYEEPAGYYMLTSDVKLKSEITKDSLSADDLHRAIGSIGAQKKLILLDTCHSGRGLDAGKLIGKRGLDDVAMVRRLNRKSGAVVLAAAESQEQALEGYQGHGLFTYAVLEALGGKADMDKDDWISTAELQGYVERRTYELAETVFKVPGQSATPSTQGSFEVLRLR